MANTSILAAFERMWQHVVAALGNKSDSDHNHNDIYYTESEMDSKLDAVNTSIANITSGSVVVAQAEEAVHAVSADSANEAVHAVSADNATRATSATKATQDASGNVITSTYETKSDASAKLATAKEYTDTKVSGLASTSTVDSKISTHNTSTSAHNDIRELISGLTTRLNTLADSDDTTLDQMSEIVAYIKSNKTLIDSITTSKVNVSDIVNNLTTNVSDKPLSAAQGVAIKDLIDALQLAVDGKADSDHTHNYAGSSSAGGAATSAVKWETTRNINGMSVDGSANRTNYGSCSTAAGTAAKTVDCTGFSLVTGAEITVKFTVSNAAANPTLNVNSTGAKPIFYRGAAIDKAYLVANRTYTFRYDGTNWDFVGDINVDTNTDTKVTQTNTTSDGDYRVLFSGTADDTSRAENARKSANLKYNPSTGTLSATEFLKDGSAVATTDDLAKYLPLTGGIVSGYISIKKNTAAPIDYYAENPSRTVSFGLSEGGKAGLYDMTNSKWIISSPVDGSKVEIPSDLFINAKNGFAYSALKNNLRECGLYLASDGAFGLYDTTNSKWILCSNSNGTNVNIPAHLSAGGITSDGYIYQNSFNNQLIMGAQNATYCHFTSSNQPFYFNQKMYSAYGKVLTADDFTVTGSASSATLTINLD